MTDSPSSTSSSYKSKKPKGTPLPPRATATPLDYQRHALEKLLADPSKPVHIPAPPPQGVKTLRPPRETMKNVQGSSAGAGSGEFHVYKQSRRREYERLKLMDEEEAYTKEKKDALDRQREAQEATESKTAKNRLKRQKRKAARSKSGAKDDEDGSADSDQDKAGVEEKKRKLGGGGMMRFKTAEERAAEDEAENGVQESEGPNEGEEVEPVVEEVAPAKEAGIFIRDED